MFLLISDKIILKIILYAERQHIRCGYAVSQPLFMMSTSVAVRPQPAHQRIAFLFKLCWIGGIGDLEVTLFYNLLSIIVNDSTYNTFMAEPFKSTEYQFTVRCAAPKFIIAVAYD